ncbi:MAG: hypothetical protein PHN37_01355 [Candidatus Pacebacteria bacterium]|nr:hypothetical protein [Candidatus Paceibacterota bacterium]
MKRIDDPEFCVCGRIVEKGKACICGFQDEEGGEKRENIFYYEEIISLSSRTEEHRLEEGFNLIALATKGL